MHKLKRIYIEIWNACNLKCAFCIQNDREVKQLTLDEFKYILEQIDPYCDYVYLHILGEPLMHPMLKDILALLAKYQKKVMITTNGTLLKDKYELLINSTVQQVNISLHSFPYHQQVKYLEDIFETAIKLSKAKIHVNYRLWSIKDNELDNVAQKLLKAVLNHYQVDEVEVKRLQRFDLAPYIHLHFEEVFEWPTLSLPYVSNEGTCLGLRQMIGILSNGEVVPCCLDSKGEASLGNIFQTSFKDIMESKKLIEALEGFNKRQVKLELCKHCTYRLRFNK